MAGGVLTASVLWLLSGLAAPIPETIRWGVLIAACLLFAARNSGILSFPMPQNARQIAQDVIQRDLLRGSTQFGFELGTGVRTYVSASPPYVVALILLLSGMPYWGALLTGIGFGLGRALTPVLRVASGDGVEWDARLIGRLRPIGVGTCIVFAVVLAMIGPWMVR